MGNGPEDNEIHQVTVELEGGVSKEAFAEYKRQLRACLDQLNKLTDVEKQKTLRVRWTRSAIKPKPPRPGH